MYQISDQVALIWYVQYTYTIQKCRYYQHRKKGCNENRGPFFMNLMYYLTIFFKTFVNIQRCYIAKLLNRGWTFTIIILEAYSKVILLVLLSNFAQCWVPRESMLRGSSAQKATHTEQNLKVTLIEWLLKLALLALHQVFRH